MRWIYLSPHLDDAVLSCGGLIREQRRSGLPVEIWTVFAGIPRHKTLSDFARLNHAPWGTGDARQTVIQRRKEDLAAAALLGAKAVHFTFSDCIYRRSPRGEFLYTERVAAPIHLADQPLVSRIASDITRRVQTGDVLVCPLALGGHVDHVIARQATETLGFPLLYYADIPYVLSTPQGLVSASQGMTEQLFPLSTESVDAWLLGVAEYRSQLSSLYSGQDTLDEAIRSWVNSRGGLPLWQVNRSSS